MRPSRTWPLMAVDSCSSIWFDMRNVEPDVDRPVSGERLESWKEIAAYLRRGVRTVRRWEQEEALPVHRHPHKKRDSVYAYPAELEAWRNQRAASAGAAPPVARPERRVMIAVLPLEPFGADSEREYLAAGLTEELISQLGRYYPERVGVIARTTMMQYRESRRTVRQIGDELSVDYVLEGVLRLEGDRLRVTSRLIRVADQSHVWSGVYDEPMQSALWLQRRLAGDIGREVFLKVPGTSRPADRTAISADAYSAYLKGRYVLQRFTPESVRRSVDLFRRALTLEPTYAAAHASLAEAYERLPVWGNQPAASTMPAAREAAQEAVRLDPTLPEGYAALGLIAANYEWNWSRAEQLFEHALELNPSCSTAAIWYAEFLAEMGRHDDALAIIDRARAHDPLSILVQTTRAFVLMMARRFDQAIAQAEEVLEIEPTYAMALIRLGVSQIGRHHYAEAADAFRRAAIAAPDLVDIRALLAFALARDGQATEATAQLTYLQGVARERYVPAFLFANVYMGFGDDDRALACLEEEYHARGWYLVLLKEAPQFEFLRAHPRFDALLQRMGFCG